MIPLAACITYLIGGKAVKLWSLREDGKILGHEAVDLVAERVERVRLGDGDDVDAVLDVELSSQVVGARLHHFQHLGNSASIQCTSTQDEMTCDMYTEMVRKIGPRLRELAPAARSQDASSGNLEPALLTMPVRDFTWRCDAADSTSWTLARLSASFEV